MKRRRHLAFLRARAQSARAFLFPTGVFPEFDRKKRSSRFDWHRYVFFILATLRERIVAALQNLAFPNAGPPAATALVLTVTKSAHLVPDDLDPALRLKNWGVFPECFAAPLCDPALQWLPWGVFPECY